MSYEGKRGAGERVLEGRHVIGLFLAVLLLSGLFFTLGREQNHSGAISGRDGSARKFGLGILSRGRKRQDRGSAEARALRPCAPSKERVGAGEGPCASAEREWRRFERFNCAGPAE